MKNILASTPIARIVRRRILAVSAATLVVTLAGAHAQILISGSTTYSENFNAIGAGSPAWQDGVTVPGFFAGINSNSTADGNLQASDGSVALSGLLNLGSTAADRAIGSKATSTNNFANIAFGVLFQNTSGFSLDITNISYVGELWRTNTTVANREQFIAFTKTSPTLFTDTEPGGSAATANVGSFTARPALDWTAPVQTGNGGELRDGNLAANRLAVSNDPNLILAPGEYFMFRWVDTNHGGTDGHQGIDDFSITFATINGPGADLFYNIGHSVGGAPNGVLGTANGNYWQVGAVGGPVAQFANNDRITFSSAATATISVPANVTPFSATVSAPSGTYTIGGAGSIGGTLLKQNAGTLVLTSANSFADTTSPSGLISGVTIEGGTIRTSALGALGTGALRVNGTGGTLEVAPATSVAVAGINGDGPLTKGDTGTLIVNGPSSGTGDVIFLAGDLQIDSTPGGTVTGVISGPVNVTVISSGTPGNAGIGGAPAGGPTDPDTLPNTYTGTTTVQSGTLVLRKDAGVTAIPGDLFIRAGGAVRYSGNNVGNQIADSSVITIDGGNFGDVTAAGVDPTNPGAAENVADVILTANGGNFSTGRAAFSVANAFRVLGGKALAHRAGTITANEVEVGATGSIDLDGGSTGVQSRLTVGGGGLLLTSGTINLNSHASAVAAGSLGSILTLNGDVTSIGASKILDIRSAIMTAAVATVDLGGIDRAFDVTGTLNIGTDAAPIALTNGGLVKDGTGNLTLTGSQTLNALIINDGVVTLGVGPAPGPAFNDAFVEAGSAQAVPEPGLLGLLAVGAFGLLGRRRR